MEKENKVFNNPNKIIAKLPININLTSQMKNCKGLVGNQVKLKLIEPVYLNSIPEDIVQTFLFMYNKNEGKGIFVNINKNKIKDWIVFNNPTKSAISKDELDLANKLKKLFEGLLKKITNINSMCFINLGNYPILHKKLYIDGKKKFIPIISFTSGYNHYDIPLPIPKIYQWVLNDINPGILFIFEKKKLNDKDSNNFKIYNRILELKRHPYYQNTKLDYAEIDGINNTKKIKLSKVNVIISDPYVPIFFQYLLNSNTHLILIENYNYYSYYSKLLLENIQYNSWSTDTWEIQLDKFVESKVITKSLKDWSDKNISMENFKEKYLGFLEHLNLNYSKSEITIEPFSNYNETKF